MSFHVGANASQTVSHTFADIEVANADSEAHSIATDTTDDTVVTLTFGGDAYKVGDTVTFFVNSVAYSAKVTSIDGASTATSLG